MSSLSNNLWSQSVPLVWGPLTTEWPHTSSGPLGHGLEHSAPVPLTDGVVKWTEAIWTIRPLQHEWYRLLGIYDNQPGSSFIHSQGVLYVIKYGSGWRESPPPHTHTLPVPRLSESPVWGLFFCFEWTVFSLYCWLLKRLFTVFLVPPQRINSVTRLICFQWSPSLPLTHLAPTHPRSATLLCFSVTNLYNLQNITYRSVQLNFHTKNIINQNLENCHLSGLISLTDFSIEKTSLKTWEGFNYITHQTFFKENT